MRERFVNWWNKADRPPIYQNIYFLIVVLFVLVAGVMFALTPPSEKVLFERAEVLMKSDDPKEWREARTYYLEPMLKRFPNGKHAEQAREYMDKIEIDVALKRMKFNARLGRDPKTDGERLYAEAWRYEQFGDAKIAMQKYQALKAETSPDGKDRPFLLLAEQRMDVLEESGALNTNHEETILALLDDAEKNAETGDMEKAREIWRGIILLYANDKELFPLVERAKNRLRGERAEAQAAKSEPTESTGEQSNDL